MLFLLFLLSFPQGICFLLMSPGRYAKLCLVLAVAFMVARVDIRFASTPMSKERSLGTPACENDNKKSKSADTVKANPEIV